MGSLNSARFLTSSIIAVNFSDSSVKPARKVKCSGPSWLQIKIEFRNPAGKQSNTPTKKVVRTGFRGSGNLSERITANKIRIDGNMVAAKMINFVLFLILF